METHRFQIMRDISNHGSQLTGARLFLQAFYFLGGGMQSCHQLHNIVVLPLGFVEDNPAGKEVEEDWIDEDLGPHMHRAKHYRRSASKPRESNAFYHCFADEKICQLWEYH
jgi:hypothetical protein